MLQAIESLGMILSVSLHGTPRDFACLQEFIHITIFHCLHKVMKNCQSIHGRRGLEVMGSNTRVLDFFLFFLSMQIPFIHTYIHCLPRSLKEVHL